MEGAYNKVYRARDRVPRPEFGFLLEKLMGTVRWVERFLMLRTNMLSARDED